jgi:hypothetical protein
MSTNLLHFKNLENFDYRLENILQKNSLYIENCSKGTVTIPIKINHITIRNCCSITFKINGCISGIDLLISKNITITNLCDTSDGTSHETSDGTYIELYKCNDNIINSISTLLIKSYFSHSNTINNKSIAINYFQPNFVAIVTGTNLTTQQLH